jgi:thioredoxin reductase (NADPH)
MEETGHGLTAATFRDRMNGTTRRCALRHLFLFLGADPNDAWKAVSTRTTRASS